MENEHSIYVSESDSISWGMFALVATGEEIIPGEPVPQFTREDIIYYSIDGSLADRLIALGICRKTLCEGKNVLVFVSPDMKTTFSTQEE